ncbi:MAG: hypothetical protein IPL61_40395 [Myxococcales bacterium]|nr:hypothetical protein [Myxococcales bacterium]
MRRLIAVALLVAAGCPQARLSRRTALVDPALTDRNDGRGRLARELEAEVRASYLRPGLDAAAAAGIIDPAVGLVAIGVGPDDVAVGLAPSRRWPVTSVGGVPARVVARALEVYVASDETLGWAYDEASLELSVCGRVATIPLRVFQVYARDNDRWTLVAEHLAYPQPMGRWLDAAVGPDGARLPEAIERQAEAQAARAAIAEAISPAGDRVATWDASPDALAVWPDPLHVVRGSATRLGLSLAESLEARAITVEGMRLALGPSRQTAVASATLAAQIVHVDASGDHPIALRLRATFVLEQRGEARGAWRVRAAMVSVPITAGALVGRTVGITADSPHDGAVAVTCPQ